MKKLIQALQQLYFLDDQQWHSEYFDDAGGTAYAAKGTLAAEVVACSLRGESTVTLNLVNSDDMARAMVIGFERASDWALVARLYQGMQEDLALPAPAVAVSGRAGYQLWLSFVECIPLTEARRFLDALRLEYLADIALSSLRFLPDAGVAGQGLVNLVPALHQVTGKWSAFIDPSMGAMFVDESGLDMAPNMDRQADMLAGLESIKTADFQRALGVLHAKAEADAKFQQEFAAEQRERAHQSASGVGRMPSKLNLGNNYTDPKTFLLAVMNDASVSAGQRIKAAKALLPYFSSNESQ